jgi:hypothetical protein
LQKRETKYERERVGFAIKKENTNSIKTKKNEEKQFYNQTRAKVKQKKLRATEEDLRTRPSKQHT